MAVTRKRTCLPFTGGENLIAFQQIFELRERHLVARGDLPDRLRDVFVADRDTQPLGLLQLQALVDKASENLLLQARLRLLGQFQARRQCRQAGAHEEIEHRDHFIVHHGDGSQRVLGQGGRAAGRQSRQQQAQQKAGGGGMNNALNGSSRDQVLRLGG
jgi:hypothetical protein